MITIRAQKRGVRVTHKSKTNIIFLYCKITKAL